MSAHPPAQAELGVSDTQVVVLNQLHQWAAEDFNAAKPYAREARQTAWSNARERINRLLTQQQLTRLNQLVIQQSRHEVFLNKGLLLELEITDEQREMIEEKWRDHLTFSKTSDEDYETLFQVRALRSSELRRAKLKSLTLARQSYWIFWSEVRKILTEPQRARFEELRGPPISTPVAGK